jgi:DNA-binding IclR family transcriptional regulator
MLRLLAETRGPVGVTSAAAALSISTAAAHRLLQSLVTNGFAMQGDGRQYELGPGVLQLAQGYLGSIDIREQCRPLLQFACSQSGETVCLIIPAGSQRICIDYTLSRHEIGHIPEVGQAHPLTAGAVGRAFLSSMSPDDSQRLGRQAAQSGSQPADWEERLEQGREDGYFVATSEVIPNMNGAAVPLYNSRREVACVLSITGPAYRWTTELIDQVLPKIVQSAQDFVVA